MRGCCSPAWAPVPVSCRCPQARGVYARKRFPRGQASKLPKRLRYRQTRANLQKIVAATAVMVEGLAPPAAAAIAALGPAAAALCGPSSCGVHVRSGGGEQGHVEEDSAASPKKRRRRAG